MLEMKRLLDLEDSGAERNVRKNIAVLGVLLAKYSSRELIQIELFHRGGGCSSISFGTAEIKNLSWNDYNLLIEERLRPEVYLDESDTELERSCFIIGENASRSIAGEYSIVLSMPNLENNNMVMEVGPNSSFLITSGQAQEQFLSLQAMISADVKLERMLDADESEKRKLLHDWNNHSDHWFESAADKSIIHLLEQQTELTPNHCAIEDESGVLTYRELQQSYRKLASYFEKNGLRHGDTVVVMMERSAFMLQSILAIWKCGAVYIPIEPDFPRERIEIILEDAQPKIIVHTDDLNGLCVNDQTTCIRLTNDILDTENETFRHDALKTARPDDLAYIIYTSGTTGRPKGAMIEHIGMLNHLMAKVKDLQLNEDSKVIQNASHTFDISIWQMFAALLAGGKTIVYSQSVIRNVSRFISKLAHDKPTILEVVPSHLAGMLDWLERRPNELTGLQYLLVTGEALSGKLVHRWFNQYAHIPLVNAYGPTEASDDITHHFITEPLPDQTRVPIGKPIINMKIFVVDENFKLCPPGKKGEIIVSGIGVGRGYLNDPEKTSRSFVTLKLWEFEELYYRTGDIGCWHPEGVLLYFGRNDEQVKIKGYRIETSEVDIMLEKCRGVAKAVTIVKKDKDQKAFLSSCLLMEEPLFDFHLVKEELRNYLPSYMIPEEMISVESFPLTLNGKIDKKKLIQQAAATSE
ncbi:amino acid adenylation domain-containing protein [Paenibacillus sp. GCM10027627]|uniref:amino acid adenylation domain-containing protein n=1 Tax=unclassified Paenibacillus TaxID=185978 RepID=UPI00363115E5